MLHITFIQDRNAGTRPTAYRSQAWPTFIRHVLRIGLAFWAAAVGYSRYYLRYHSPSQVLVGLATGVLVGAAHWGLTEGMPFYYPTSMSGKARRWIRSAWERWPFEGFGGWGPGGGPRRSAGEHVTKGQ